MKNIIIITHPLHGKCEYYPDGLPCKHNGCINHVTHKCEYCGRIKCNGEVYIPIVTNVYNVNILNKNKIL